MTTMLIAGVGKRGAAIPPGRLWAKRVFLEPVLMLGSAMMWITVLPLAGVFYLAGRVAKGS